MVIQQAYPIPSHAGSGPSKVITFVMKKDDLELLDELVGKFPAHMNRSDVMREMILPYVHALRAAKNGEECMKHIDEGAGLSHLRQLIQDAESDAQPVYSYSI